MIYYRPNGRYFLGLNRGKKGGAFYFKARGPFENGSSDSFVNVDHGVVKVF